MWMGLSLSLVYTVAEVGLTGYERIFGDNLFYLMFERTETEPIRFDPISGYRFAPTPHRFCGVWHGSQECDVVRRANRQGFPDTRDFQPQRERPGVKRRRIRRFIYVGHALGGQLAQSGRNDL